MSNATTFRAKPLFSCILIAMCSQIFSTSAIAADPDSRTSKTDLQKQKEANKNIRESSKELQDKSISKADGDASAIKTTNDPAQPANPDHGKYTDQYVKDYFTNTGVLPGTPLLAMPQKMRRSAGRYGEFRNRSSANDYHAGIDMTPLSYGAGLNLRAPGPGTVNSVFFADGTGNSIIVKRKNGDKYQFLHLENNLKNSHPIGSKVEFGQPLGRMGATGGSFPIHLHFNYILPKNQRNRWRNMWLSSSTKPIGSKRFKLQSNTGIYASSTGLKTDPTPYLAEDLKVAPDGYTKWLGSTIRQQFNVLYNTKLPLGPGAKSNLAPLPAVPRYQTEIEWTPDELAAARASLVKGAAYADWSGYTGAFGAGGMSYQVLTSFISSTDGKQFGSLPQPENPISIETMTPRQIVDFVSTQRYGNQDWEKAAMELSSKGMLTEYTMMNATENYLSQQNQRLRNRIELLLAGINQARLFEYNKKIEALQVEATAAAVPSVLDLDLVNLGYSYGGGGGNPPVDINNLPGELNGLMDVLLDAIGHGEGQWNSFNTGTKGKCKMSSYVSDKAAASAPGPMITNMTIRQIYDSAYGVSNCIKTRKFTAGKFQITYYTLAGESGFGSGGFIRSHPDWANKKMTQETQEYIAKSYLLLQKRKPLADFLKDGTGSIDIAQKQIAMEWASVAVPDGMRMANRNKRARYSDGTKSYYESKWNHANQESTRMVRAILTKIKMWHEANPGKARAVLAGEAEDISIDNKSGESEASSNEQEATGTNTNESNSTGSDNNSSGDNNTDAAK